MRTRDKSVIAVLCSDIHLSMKPPVCRGLDVDDWFAVMADYLDQLKDAASSHHVPVVCAGDIFDKWNAPAELINFAIANLPEGVYAIPGQHDLPEHNYSEMNRSAYGTLVEAGAIIDLREPTQASASLMLHPFPWGFDIEPLEKQDDDFIHLAVIHKYCWKAGKSYPGAPETQQASAYRKQLKGYHAALFGDNHKGFTAKAGKCSVLNNGGFMRRKKDEIDYQPCIGLLYEDGTVARMELDISIDSFDTNPEYESDETDFNLNEFIKELDNLGEGDLDFVEQVKRVLETKQDELTERSKLIIKKALNL